MSRGLIAKSIFMLALVLALTAAVLPVGAQDDGATIEDEATVVEQVDETQSGILQLFAVTCADGGEPGSVALWLTTEFAPDADCVDGSSVLLVDGVDYGMVAPTLEIELEAGMHTLLDPNSGVSRDVEVVAGGVVGVFVVTFATAPVPTEEPPVEAAAETTGSLLIVAHACKPDVQSVDQLFALGNRLDRWNACPAFTLPGFPAPGGAVSGGEFDFDFTLSPVSGDAQTLTGNGSFVPDAFCESAVGLLDNDPTNDRCVSTSGFAFELPEGSITLTQTYIPETMHYVAAEMGDDADGGVLTNSDPAAGFLALDTSLRGTDQPVIHLYYLNPPRVNVVAHLCDPSIASSDDLAALGSLAAQLLACPATARAVDGGAVDFGVTVTDNNWGARGLESAFFDPTVICEADIGDWDGDGADNVCLDAPTYRFDQTAMGSVSVTQDFAPAGFVFGGANSKDAGTIVAVDLAVALVTLDTSYDGDVTLHLFDLVAIPATSTPTPTRTAVPPTATRTLIPATATRTPIPAATRTPAPSVTATATSPAATQTATPPLPASTPTATATTSAPTGTGTLIVAALYCLSGSGTTVIALPPGQQASASDLGGSGCFSGDATITLTLADGNTIPALKLGRDGVEAIQNIPPTGSTAHTITEGLTNQQTNFAIAPDTITRVIIRYGAGSGMVDEGVVSSGGVPGSTTGPDGKPIAPGGLVTDELIGDAGVSSSEGSYSGISFTSLVIENVDAQAVSSVKDAKSLPGVGVFPVISVRQYLALIVICGLLLMSVALAARRSVRREG